MSNRNDYKNSGIKNDQSNPKLEWMYKGSDLINREEYLLGRSVDKNFEQLDSETKREQKLVGVQVPKNHVEYECIPFSIREYKQNTQFVNSEQVDLQRKIMEDPLITIKQKEIDERKKLLENPVKLKELHRLLKIEQDDKKMNRRKSSKKSSKKKKYRRDSSESSSSGSDLDKKLAKKLKKSGGLDKLMKKKYDALTKELDSSAGKKKRASSEEWQPSESDSNDELDEILTKKFKSIKDTASLKALLAESAEKKTHNKSRKSSKSDRSEKSYSPEKNNYNRKTEELIEHKNPFRDHSGFKTAVQRGNFRGGRSFRGAMNWNKRGGFNRGGQNSRGGQIVRGGQNARSGQNTRGGHYNRGGQNNRGGPNDRGYFNPHYPRTREKSRDRFQKSRSKERYQRSRSKERYGSRENMLKPKYIAKDFQYRQKSSITPDTKNDRREYLQSPKRRHIEQSLSPEKSMFQAKYYEKDKFRSEPSKYLNHKKTYDANRDTYYKQPQRDYREYKQKQESSRSRSISRSKDFKKTYRRDEPSTSYENKYRNESYNQNQQRKLTSKSHESIPYDTTRDSLSYKNQGNDNRINKTDNYKKISLNNQINKKDYNDSAESRYNKSGRFTSPHSSTFSKKRSYRNSASPQSDSEHKKYIRKPYEKPYKQHSITPEKNSRNQGNKKKFSEEEKERLREEMMEAASKRDIERTQKVHGYRKQVEKEESMYKSKKFDTHFASNELKKAYGSSKSIESRIKSNLNNIQRSSGAMDRNFARK